MQYKLPIGNICKNIIFQKRLNCVKTPPTTTNAAQDAVINQERTVAAQTRTNKNPPWLGALLASLGVILIIISFGVMLSPPERLMR